MQIQAIGLKNELSLEVKFNEGYDTGVLKELPEKTCSFN